MRSGGAEGFGRCCGVAVRRVRNLVLDGFLPVALAVALYLNGLMTFDGHLLVRPGDDSWSYLNFGLNRPLGYPVFTWAIRELLGDLHWIGVIQLNLMLASYLLLAVAVRTLLGSWLAGMAVFVLAAFDGELLSSSYQVMAEPLFTALVGTHVALVLFLLRRFSLPLALLAGLALSAAILVRPAGEPILIGIPFLALVLRRHWRGVVLGVGGGAASLLVLASTINLVNHGVFSPQVYGGSVLISSVGYLVQDDPESRYPDLTRAIDREIGADAARLRALPVPHDHWICSIRHNYPIWEHIFIEIWQYALRTPGLSNDQYALEQNRIAATLARETILRHPWGYARHVLSYYYGMWRGGLDWPAPLAATAAVDYRLGETAARHYDKDDNAGFLHLFFESDQGARYFAERRDHLTPADRLWALVTAPDSTPTCRDPGLAGPQAAAEPPAAGVSLRLPLTALVFAGSIGFLACLVLVRRRPAALNAMIYVSLIVNGYFLFVAMVSNALYRYVVVVEPLWAVIGVGTVVFCWRLMRGGIRKG